MPRRYKAKKTKTTPIKKDNLQNNFTDTWVKNLCEPIARLPQLEKDTANVKQKLGMLEAALKGHQRPNQFRSLEIEPKNDISLIGEIIKFQFKIPPFIPDDQLDAESFLKKNKQLLSTLSWNERFKYLACQMRYYSAEGASTQAFDLALILLKMTKEMNQLEHLALFEKSTLLSELLKHANRLTPEDSIDLVIHFADLIQSVYLKNQSGLEIFDINMGGFFEIFNADLNNLYKLGLSLITPPSLTTLLKLNGINSQLKNLRLLKSIIDLNLSIDSQPLEKKTLIKEAAIQLVREAVEKAYRLNAAKTPWISKNISIDSLVNMIKKSSQKDLNYISYLLEFHMGIELISDEKYQEFIKKSIFANTFNHLGMQHIFNHFSNLFTREILVDLRAQISPKKTLDEPEYTLPVEDKVSLPEEIIRELQKINSELENYHFGKEDCILNALCLAKAVENNQDWMKALKLSNHLSSFYLLYTKVLIGILNPDDGFREYIFNLRFLNEIFYKINPEEYKDKRSNFLKNKTIMIIHNYFNENSKLFEHLISNEVIQQSVDIYNQTSKIILAEEPSIESTDVQLDELDFIEYNPSAVNTGSLVREPIIGGFREGLRENFLPGISTQIQEAFSLEASDPAKAFKLYTQTLYQLNCQPINNLSVRVQKIIHIVEIQMALFRLKKCSSNDLDSMVDQLNHLQLYIPHIKENIGLVELFEILQNKVNLMQKKFANDQEALKRKNDQLTRELQNKFEEREDIKRKLGQLWIINPSPKNEHFFLRFQLQKLITSVREKLEYYNRFQNKLSEIDFKLSAVAKEEPILPQVPAKEALLPLESKKETPVEPVVAKDEPILPQVLAKEALSPLESKEETPVESVVAKEEPILPQVPAKEALSPLESKEETPVEPVVAKEEPILPKAQNKKAALPFSETTTHKSSKSGSSIFQVKAILQRSRTAETAEKAELSAPQSSNVENSLSFFNINKRDYQKRLYNCTNQREFLSVMDAAHSVFFNKIKGNPDIEQLKNNQRNCYIYSQSNNCLYYFDWVREELSKLDWVTDLNKKPKWMSWYNSSQWPNEVQPLTERQLKLFEAATNHTPPQYAFSKELWEEHSNIKMS